MFSQGRVIRFPEVTDMTSEQKSTLKQFWACFDANDVIGIQGICGVGKSALLRKINNTFIEDMRGFETVVFVDLSIERCQDVVIKRLELIWHGGKKPDGNTVSAALDKKKVLLLLDDLQYGVTLEDIDVPTPKNGSKIVFTSQIRGMWSDTKPHPLKLNCSGFEDGLKLLKQYAGYPDTEDHQHPDSWSEIETLVRDVAKECGGLPFVLIKIGRYMSGLSHLDAWRSTHQALANPDPERFEEVCLQLKTCYARLDTNLYKKCFLYCSLFPKDHLIQQERLIWLWIGEGLLGDNLTFKQAYDYGSLIIKHLMRVSLLNSAQALTQSRTQTQDRVEMHGMILLMAMWVASDKSRNDINDFFFLKSGGSLEALADRDWETTTRISLVKVNIILTGAEYDFQNLSTLILKNCQLREIPTKFFSSMKNLKVLDLSWSDLHESPPEIAALTTLRYLDLSHTNLTRLPTGLDNLKKLKFLDLSFTLRLKEIRKNVIVKLIYLLSLNMYYCAPGKGTRQSNFPLPALSKRGDSVLFEELKKLKLVESLGITLKSGDAFKELENLESIHSILITQFKATPSIHLTPIVNLKFLKVLHVIDCPLERMEVGNPKSGSYFPKLGEIKVKKCPKLKDLSWVRYASVLELLEVENCAQLECILSDDSGTTATRPLLKLQSLCLKGLTKLTTIYDGVLSSEDLKEIRVFSCPKLKIIQLDLNVAPQVSIEGQNEWWVKLDMGEPGIKSSVSFSLAMNNY